MVDPLVWLWPLVDAADPVFGHDLLETWPAGIHGRLLDMALVRQAESVNAVLCPNCHEHVDEVIVLDGPGGEPRFCIPCPESLRAEIAPERLRQWRVDRDRLVELLADALSPGALPQAIVPGMAWCLGHLSVAGAAYNVVFLRMARGQELHEAMGNIARLLPPARTVLLVALTDRAGEICRDDFAGVVPLARCCRLADGAIRLDTDSLKASLHADPRAAAFVFRREGQMWTISFEGESVHMKDSVGLAYIARLLAEPHRDTPAVSLLAARAGIDPQVAAGSTGEVLDDEARRAYQRRYTDLVEDLAEAEKNNDLGNIEKLQAEMDQLATELAGATGLGGRSRKKTDAEKVRKSVSMAVARAIESIQAEHSPLARHLTAFISSGIVFRYSPDPSIEWLT